MNIHCVSTHTHTVITLYYIDFGRTHVYVYPQFHEAAVYVITRPTPYRDLRHEPSTNEQMTTQKQWLFVLVVVVTLGTISYTIYNSNYEQSEYH